MKPHVRNFLFILFFGLTSTSAPAAPKDPPRVPKVRVEWELVKGAKEYEIELYDDTNGFKAKSHSSTNRFDVRVPIGIYKLRGRVSDRRGVWGPWSKFEEFTVTPLAIKDLTFSEPSKVYKSNLKTLTPIIQFTWKKSLGADSYVVKILNEQNKAVFDLETITLKATTSLPPGRYQVEVTPNSLKKLMGPTKTDAFVVEGMQLPPPLATEDSYFGECKRWKNQNQSTAQNRVTIDRKQFLGTDWKTLLSDTETTANTYVKKRMPPGQYRLTVWATKQGYMDSTPLVQECIVKPTEEDLVIRE